MSMTFLQCPYCRKPGMTFHLVSVTRNKRGKSVSFWFCGECKNGIVCVSHADPSQYSEFPGGDFISIFPEVQNPAAPQHTPPAVAADLVEAKTSLASQCYKAACIMAGSAIETACVQMGAGRGTLSEKIVRLRESGLIAQSLATWAAEIKTIRNTAAHQAERGAKGQPTALTAQDAEDAVAFADMLCIYLYTLPGMIEARAKAKK